MITIIWFREAVSSDSVGRSPVGFWRFLSHSGLMAFQWKAMGIDLYAAGRSGGRCLRQFGSARRDKIGRSAVRPLRRDHLVARSRDTVGILLVDRVVFCLVEEPPAVRRTVVTSSGSSGRPFNAVSFSLLVGWPVAFSTTIVISSSAAT